MLILSIEKKGLLHSAFYLPHTSLADITAAHLAQESVYLLTETGYYKECEIKSWDENPSDKILVQINTIKEDSLQPGMADILMAGKKSLSYSREFMDIFFQWQTEFSLPPLELHIRQDKKGLHLEYYDSFQLCRQSWYFPDSKWNPLKTEIEDSVSLIDESLQQQHWEDLNNMMHSISLILKKILHQLPWEKISAMPYRRIRIFENELDTFIPWEFLFPSHHVEFPLCIDPVDTVSMPAAPCQFSSVYDPDLAHSPSEAGRIIELMQSRWEVESFSDAHYEDYKSHLSNTDILHIAVHGRAQFKKGQICLNKKWYQNLLFSSHLYLACFNTCHSGKYPSGIVHQTLQQGAKYVLSSPYAIPDTDWSDFSRFYLHFQAQYVQASIAFFALLDKRFHLFYRKYSAYQVKI